MGTKVIKFIGILIILKLALDFLWFGHLIVLGIVLFALWRLVND